MSLALIFSHTFYTLKLIKKEKTVRAKNIYKTIHNGNLRFVVQIDKKGKRLRRFFTSENLARKFLKEYKESQEKGLSDFAAMSHERLADIRKAIQLLPEGESLTEIVQARLKILAPLKTPLPKAFNLYKEHLTSLNGGEEPYIRVSAFFKEFKTWEDATPNAVMDWLISRGAPKTVREARSALNKFYEFAKRRGYTVVNPCENIAPTDLPKVERSEVGIWDIDSAKLFFEFLEKNNPDRVNFFAVACFAGVRRATIERLSAKNFNIEGRKLMLPYKDVKTGDTWLLEDLPDNFWLWIEKYGTEFKGLFNKPFNNLREKFSALHLKELGREWQWKDNMCRHSFATYHLSLHKDMVKTAHVLCHRNPNTMWQHYLAGLADTETAEAYFNIRPQI